MFSGLFMSQSKRQAQQEGLQRAIVRRAERAVRKLKDDVERLTHDRDKAMAAAKACVRTGSNDGALHHLSVRKDIEIDIALRQRPIRLIERHVRKFDLARTEQVAVFALAGLKGLEIVEPMELESLLDGLTDKSELRQETERVWEAAEEREMASLGIDTGRLPSVEQMLADLQQEVAAEIGAEGTRAAEQAAALEADIAASRQRLTDLMETAK